MRSSPEKYRVGTGALSLFALGPADFGHVGLLRLVGRDWLRDCAKQSIRWQKSSSLAFLFFGCGPFRSADRSSFAVSSRGVVLGVIFGVAVLGAALGLYHGWLKSAEFFTAGIAPIQTKVAELGISSPWKFTALGVFYSLCHSFLEEYYWRWFVFDQLKRLVPLLPAILLSAVGFMAHHVLVVSTFFGMGSPITWFLSLSVAVGGVFWAWLYDRSGSLLGPWLGHLSSRCGHIPNWV